MAVHADPTHLYHYTTANGLVGILADRALWASNVYFLNDIEEFRLGLKAAHAYMERRAAAAPNSAERQRWFWLDHQTLGLGPQSSLASYVACLSEDGDSLSQWRAYCASGGFSIGFPRDQLQDLAQAQRFTLCPCEYDNKAHDDRMSAAVDRVASEWAQSAADDWEDDSNTARFDVSSRLIWQLFREAPILKDTAFREEREWRIISQPERREGDQKFRARQGLVIPYVELRLGSEAEFWRQVKVVAGPSPHPAEARAGARALLRFHTGFALPVMNTEIPFRYW